MRHYALNENMMSDASDKEKLGYFVADVERAGAACMQAEAVAMANRVTRRKKAILSGGLHPHYREVVETHGRHTGFDTYDINRDYSTRGSLGMVNMRERAERIDGSLRVESSPDSGTTVTLVVPLDKHRPPAEEDALVVTDQPQLIDAGG